MKVLCATDFSDVSINAIEWTFEMLKKAGGGELEIVHCVETLRRSDMLVSMDDLLIKHALQDMKALEQKFIDPIDNVKVSTSVHKAYIKNFIPPYASQKEFDLIVTGTTGLTSLKNMLVGSVTDHFSKHSDIPLLTIPEKSKFKSLDSVVIGLGKEELRNTNNLSLLYNLLDPHDPRVFLTQVMEKNHHTLSVDLRIESYLKDLTYEYMPVEQEGSINATLNNFCKEVEADMLCMVHYKRNWLEKFWHKSITKEELYSIETPLLIIPD